MVSCVTSLSNPGIDRIPRLLHGPIHSRQEIGQHLHSRGIFTGSAATTNVAIGDKCSSNSYGVGKNLFINHEAPPKGFFEHMNTKRPPKNPDQRRAWILYQLHLVGSSFADLGRELNVTRNAVHNAIDKRYPKMERAIAAKIGKRPEEIWPERYAA